MSEPSLFNIPPKGDLPHVVFARRLLEMETLKDLKDIYRDMGTWVRGEEQIMPESDIIKRWLDGESFPAAMLLAAIRDPSSIVMCVCGKAEGVNENFPITFIDTVHRLDGPCHFVDELPSRPISPEPELHMSKRERKRLKREKHNRQVEPPPISDLLGKIPPRMTVTTSSGNDIMSIQVTPPPENAHYHMISYPRMCMDPACPNNA